MKTFKAVGKAQYTDQSKKRIVRKFKALSEYDAMHYIINHFDCSYTWVFSEV